MATAPAPAPPADDRKRVKVYELKNNDWYDRGTGFCTGEIIDNGASAAAGNGGPEFPDARIIVHSEDDPARKLLETRITKDDGYQQQQQTLIVWTEANGIDMALSFQEADGCTAIWQFVSEVQAKLSAFAPEGALSDDDMLESAGGAAAAPVVLPKPQLGRLEDVVMAIRHASQTQTGRDALVKFIMNPESIYIDRLAPLVEEAEDLESTYDLHQLCTIMKHLILLNDNSIIEYIVTDEAIMGVLGALEYDPDFPSHRAAHRQFLRETSKFKEIVEFKDPEIRNKIQYTHRLLYLKDVVLARILDDPTFSVLNSLIFFHHVDIIQYITSDPEHCAKLFAIINDENEDQEKKKTAVLFIQNCCAVAKNIQPVNRAGLYNALVSHGLFSVVGFALRHRDASVRVAGTDILVSLIDQDAAVVRSQVNRDLSHTDGPLMDTLIDLLLVEVDLGVKSQMADAIKILLDPSSSVQALELLQRQNSDMKQRGINQHYQNSQQAEHHRLMKVVVSQFYESGAKRLFQPLKDLEQRKDLSTLSVQELSLYTHLVEILCFFVRQHVYDIKPFIRAENLHARIARLLQCRKKYMRLVALKWFRTCIGLQDEFHNQEMIRARLFEPILEIVYETMPRDNLLNSACLELFEYMRREGLQSLIRHLVDTYRARLLGITYVPTFYGLVNAYERGLLARRDLPDGGADNSFTTEPDTPPASSGGGHHPRDGMPNGRQLFTGLKEDPEEEAYFNAADDDDFDGDLPDEDELAALPSAHIVRSQQHPQQQLPNGHANARGPLVDYPEDDDYDDDEPDLLASSPEVTRQRKAAGGREEDLPVNHDDNEEPRGRKRVSATNHTPPAAHSTSGSLTPIKRRREDDDDDDDELGKLMGGGPGSGNKRRLSSASLSSKTYVGETPSPFDGGSAASSDTTLENLGTSSSRASGGEHDGEEAGGAGAGERDSRLKPTQKPKQKQHHPSGGQGSPPTDSPTQSDDDDHDDDDAEGRGGGGEEKAPAVQQPAAVGHGHMLRRKGSLKVRNETTPSQGQTTPTTTNGKVSIKLNLAKSSGPKEAGEGAGGGRG